ncbi:MAG: threonine/serine exporter family protein, partial [Myxococcales bacterium]
PAVTVLCYCLAAATGAHLLGGAPKEMAVSGAIGLVLGALAVLSGRYANVGRVLEPVAAFVASALSVIGTRLVGHYSPELTTLASLVFLLPGLTLTLAMTELATRNLVSGTSRLTWAAVVFLLLAFGVALGHRIDLILPPAPAAVALPCLPDWTLVPTLVVITLALAVLFRARLSEGRGSSARARSPMAARAWERSCSVPSWEPSSARCCSAPAATSSRGCGRSLRS